MLANVNLTISPNYPLSHCYHLIFSFTIILLFSDLSTCALALIHLMHILHCSDSYGKREL